MQKEIRFDRLREFLLSLDFTEGQYVTHIVFRHSSGRPVIILPVFKRDEIVSPIHLLMVKKQLSDAGVLGTDEFNLKMQEVSTVD